MNDSAWKGNTESPGKKSIGIKIRVSISEGSLKNACDKQKVETENGHGKQETQTTVHCKAKHKAANSTSEKVPDV